jgi:hypothetical protein
VGALIILLFLSVLCVCDAESSSGGSVGYEILTLLCVESSRRFWNVLEGSI